MPSRSPVHRMVWQGSSPHAVRRCRSLLLARRRQAVETDPSGNRMDRQLGGPEPVWNCRERPVRPPNPATSDSAPYARIARVRTACRSSSRRPSCSWVKYDGASIVSAFKTVTRAPTARTNSPAARTARADPSLKSTGTRILVGGHVHVASPLRFGGDRCYPQRVAVSLLDRLSMTQRLESWSNGFSMAG